MNNNQLLIGFVKVSVEMTGTVLNHYFYYQTVPKNTGPLSPLPIVCNFTYSRTPVKFWALRICQGIHASLTPPGCCTALCTILHGISESMKR